MKNRISVYSCKDGLLSLTLDGSDLTKIAKKDDPVTLKGLGELDGTYKTWNVVAPNMIQFSHSTNNRLSAHPDLTETHPQTDATAELAEHSKTQTAR